MDGEAYRHSLSTDYDFSDADTVAYLSLGGTSCGSSQGSSPSDSFDSSDDEPLIKYKEKIRPGDETQEDEPPSQSLPSYEEFTKHKRSRPKGCAKPPPPAMTSAGPRQLLNKMLEGTVLMRNVSAWEYITGGGCH